LLPLAGSRPAKISNNSSPWAYCARLAANKPEENTRVPVKLMVEIDGLPADNLAHG
jgi:sulfite reductase beta subunit-like hemoprotein